MDQTNESRTFPAEENVRDQISPQTDAPDEQDIFPVDEGFSEENARAVKSTLQRFVKSYGEKSADETDEAWLEKELSAELPEESPETIRSMSREIIESVAKWNDNIRSVNEACARGEAKESWLADKLQESAVGMNVAEYGQYLSGIDSALRVNNQQMMDTIMTQRGTVNMNPNLDGFLAEQEIANSFNQDAALNNSSEYAEVLKPKPGEGYHKNSVDIVLRDSGTSKITRRYQVKFGKDAQQTAKYLLEGDYRGQRALVPTEQKEAVEKILREHGSRQTVTDHVESLDGKTRSKPLGKEDLKRLQKQIQEGKGIPMSDWNSYNTRELALGIGKQAAFAGLASAGIATGFHIARKLLDGEEIEANEVIDVALKSGTLGGVTTAAAGALTASVRKGFVPMIAKGAEASTITMIAAAGIESLKIVDRFMSGELTLREAMDAIGRTACSVAAGGMAGAALGAALGSVIPVVGTFIGGVIGYMAGSEIGGALCDAAMAIRDAVWETASTVWDAVCDIGNTIASGVSEIFSSIFD